MATGTRTCSAPHAASAGRPKPQACCSHRSTIAASGGEASARAWADAANENASERRTTRETFTGWCMGGATDDMPGPVTARRASAMLPGMGVRAAPLCFREWRSREGRHMRGGTATPRTQSTPARAWLMLLAEPVPVVHEPPPVKRSGQLVPLPNWSKK